MNEVRSVIIRTDFTKGSVKLVPKILLVGYRVTGKAERKSVISIFI